jgi:IclR family transcriptional regulator, KDG regulon repressor
MDQSQYMIKVLEKAIKLLDCYTPAENSFTLDELTKRTKLSKPTVFRILKTLEKNGFLRYSQKDETYRLGLRLLDLGSIVYTTSTVRSSAAPYLDDLARTLKCTILVGVMIEDQFVYVDKRESESILKIPAHLGARRPPTDTALGMTLLAFLENGERKRLLKLHPVKKHTEATITRTKEVTDRLDEAKQKGYYIERHEFIEGVAGIGVPIKGFAGKVVAALGACLPEFRAKDSEVERTVHALIKTSNLISKEIGFPNL